MKEYYFSKYGNVQVKVWMSFSQIILISNKVTFGNNKNYIEGHAC
jgi:hypothetical protein